MSATGSVAPRELDQALRRLDNLVDVFESREHDEIVVASDIVDVLWNLRDLLKEVQREVLTLARARLDEKGGTS